ncbi:MAG TPA: hypothetical protein VL132_04795, partial [Planctomycetaceae bacterium]|nr:hypothetical protein [Planctomycetaceae bacterium]
QVGSDWDAHRLVELLDELTDIPDFDVTLTGFDDKALHDLLLEPEKNLPGDDAESNTVRVTLEIPRDQWERARPEIDDLAQRYDCKLHVDA